MSISEKQRDGKKLLDAKEIAAVLGLKTPAVHRYARMKIIPSKSLGRQRRFDPDQVLAALDRER